MAIKYYLKQNNVKNSLHRGHYYARTARGREVTLDEIEREIEHVSTATRGDVKLVLQTLHDVMKLHLQRGECVNLNPMGLGRHYIAVRSKMVERAEDFGEGHIVGYEVRSVGTMVRPRMGDHHACHELTLGCRAERLRSKLR